MSFFLNVCVKWSIDSTVSGTFYSLNLTLFKMTSWMKMNVVFVDYEETYEMLQLWSVNTSYYCWCKFIGGPVVNTLLTGDSYIRLDS